MKGYVRASRSTVALPAALDGAAGRAVSDAKGQHIGHVSDVIFDEFHVERAFVEIESDGVFEINHKHFLAPVAALDLESDPIVVSLTVDETRELPAHDASMPFSEEYEMALMGFWGTQFSHDVEAVRDPLVERPGETHSMRAEQFDDDPGQPHTQYRTRDRG
jgi:hypothetical protein